MCVCVPKLPKFLSQVNKNTDLFGYDGTSRLSGTALWLASASASSSLPLATGTRNLLCCLKARSQQGGACKADEIKGMNQAGMGCTGSFL